LRKAEQRLFEEQQALDGDGAKVAAARDKMGREIITGETRQAGDVKNLFDFRDADEQSLSQNEQDRLRAFRQSAKNQGARAEAIRIVLPELGRDGSRTDARGENALEFVRNFERLTGRKVTFFRADPSNNLAGGVVQSMPDQIWINADANRGLFALLGHEWGHTVQHSQPEIWKRLQSFILSHADDVRAQAKKLKSPEYQKPKTLTVELTNNMIGDAFADPEFWKTLEAKDKSLFEKILAAVAQWFHELADKVGNSEWGTQVFTNQLREMHEGLATFILDSATSPDARLDSVNDLELSASTMREPGPVSTLTVEHLLLTHDTAAVAVNLNFAASAGTITTENWFHGHYPEVDILADVAGNNSLTVRGYGELNYRAAASFSGGLVVAGGYLNLADAGSFANVDTVRLGAEGGITSSLELYGVDNTGPTPVTVNRLKDDAHIVATGYSELNLESDSAGATATTEKVGDIVVTGSHSNFPLAVQVGDLDTHSAASAAGWEVASLSFDASASNSGIFLAAFGEGNIITINGGPILLENGNYLSVIQQSGGRVITHGIGIAEGSSASFHLQGQIEGNLDLQGGGFSISGTESSIVGNLTMGMGLGISLALPTLSNDAPFGMFAVSEVPPMLFIDGDLTLGGTFYIAQTGAFETGSWLVFQYSGDFSALGWTINGLDGDYTLTVDEMSRSVYVNAVPEPSTYALLLIGAVMLALGFRRRGKGNLPTVSI
jgi:hypothetical protein